MAPYQDIYGDFDPNEGDFGQGMTEIPLYTLTNDDFGPNEP